MIHGKGLDTVLDLDGVIIEQVGGCWTKFEVRQVPPYRRNTPWYPL